MLLENNIYRFNNLSVENLTHAISTRSFGSMKDHGEVDYDTLQEFLPVLSIQPDQVVLAEQIHSGNVSLIEKASAEVVKGVDGLITKEKNIFLGILTADCLPILFYDTNKTIIGAAHAGYKGLSKEIIKHMLDGFKHLGSDPKEILVGIGPSIGVCCYTVPKERVELFQTMFPGRDDFFTVMDDTYSLDLKKIARLQLLEEGIAENNIEVADICTKDDAKEFFSYRVEGEESGRFISLIGML